MPRLDLTGVRNELLDSGISPRHVRRTVDELNDHFEDLYRNARAGGADTTAARHAALQELGDLDNFVAAMRERTELRSWAFRYPHLALFVYPLTCLAVLPAVPVLVGFANADRLARWATSLLLSGLVTAAMLLVLQLTITLT